ncbi:MAG: aspartate carbamoyltransferase catalytic subunit [Rothia sp. (in: high G+C Gram-positive bacteria)]|uniref:aspartate carbamoyltransferase catalytic subunit n=1 Tax=Rothia sp. (in: high G+C Gram-positive bacteria) TaxID=1885016 RepID=UPI0026DF719C|nr:aspartate carbamoyltransferase catalytic subunit [Rothia sp. (in: high G+C Gram-positive bacteria)]MDO5750686.1 aspartate carbamoyltransferase catalytic subunit [Rothia sp. (in: high G+C Gram-positive bacteria)]
MKHLLDTRELTREEAIDILDIADYMAQVKAENKKLSLLKDKLVVNLFFEDSTRTRLSFESAEKRLGADIMNFAAKGSSVSKGESLKDTAQTLAEYNADAFVIRHSADGAPYRLATAGWTNIPVLNAGDGTHAHPTQALLDAMSLRKFKAARDGVDSRGTDLAGLRVLIVGDILHSRVARSNLWLLRTLGAQVAFVAPPTLLPLDTHAWDAEIFHDFDEAIATAPDAVMMLRIQKERMNAAYFPSAEEYTELWGLTKDRFEALEEMGKPFAILHPGPMNRGLELCSEAADANESWVLRQVSNGVAVRMAVLYQLLCDGTAAKLYAENPGNLEL